MRPIRRLLQAAILALLVAGGALLPPATARAADPEAYGLWLAGTEVTSGNADDVLGDGTARYDAATATLTLENCAATGNEADPPAPMLLAEHNLTLELLGENALVAGTGAYGVLAERDLTVTGGGSLAAYGGRADRVENSAGIACGGALTFDGGFSGSVVATGGACGGLSAGISCQVTMIRLHGGTVVATGGSALTSVGIQAGTGLVQKGGLLVAQGGDASKESYGIYGSSCDFTGGFAVARAGLAHGGLDSGRWAVQGPVSLGGTRVAGCVGWRDGLFEDLTAEIEDAGPFPDLSVCTGVAIVPTSATEVQSPGDGTGAVRLAGDAYHVATDGTNFGSDATMPELDVDLDRHTALLVSLYEGEGDDALAGYAMGAGAATVSGPGTLAAVGGTVAQSGKESVGLRSDGRLAVVGAGVVCVGGPSAKASTGLSSAGPLTVTNGSVTAVGGSASRGASCGASCEEVKASGSSRVLAVGGHAITRSQGISGNASSDGTASVLGVGGPAHQSLGIDGTATAGGGTVTGVGGCATQYSVGCLSGMDSHPGGRAVGLGGVARDTGASYGCGDAPCASHAGDQVVAGRTGAYDIYESGFSSEFPACDGGATGLGYTDYAGTQGETPLGQDTTLQAVSGLRRVVIGKVPATLAVSLGATGGGAVSASAWGYTHDIPAGGGLNLVVRPGSTVTLAATPQGGHRFAGWYEGVVGPSHLVEGHTDTLVSGDATYAFVPTGPVAVQAVFVEEPPASQRVTWSRLWGQVALDTMQAIARECGKAGVAVVTTNAGFKDALAASCLAGRHNALVLTTPKGEVARQTRAALKAAGVKTVYLVGSTSDVTAATERALKSGTGVTKVVRISGASPSAKAVAVARACGKRSDTVIIATQGSFKDALSIAPYSYATKSPILYAESNKSLSAATLKYIKDSRFSKAIIVGGPVALPASIESQLTRSAGIKAANITRLAGGDSYATSEVIARWATGKYTDGQTVGAYQGKPLATIRFQPTTRMTSSRLAVATSQSWKDALCGAALCGKNRSVLLLADSATARSDWARATGFCNGDAATIGRAYVLGGTSAVSKRVWDALVASTIV